MPLFKLSEKSLCRLEGVDERLVNVVKKAITITTVDFCVLEGLRTVERQKELVKLGKSQTMNSRHLTGHAVDLGAFVDGEINWSSKYYDDIATAMFKSGAILNVPLRWGGSFKTFKDLVHFEISRGF